eukprot:g742.t1
MRKAYKAKCHAEKQREVQKMIDRAVEHLQNMSNTEAARLDRDVKAKKESDDRKAREKAEWRQRNWEACDKSRKGQMANRARKAREQRKRDVELRNKWAAQCLAMKEQTRQEKADIRSKNEKNAAFLNDQIREKQLKRERSRANKLRFEKEALRKDKQDEEEFVAYLRKQVDEAAALGKNVESMKRVLRPRAFLNDQIREKQLKRERSRANKLRFEKEALRKDKQDEEEFVAYLRKQVDEAAALGKNVESMKRVLRPRGLGNI